MQKKDKDLFDRITRLAEENPRYSREALIFVLHGIQWSFEEIGQRRHLTGQEFTELLIAFAREQFGEMASVVFQEWGIYETSDLGEIVYQLIEAGLLSKQEEDSIEDFENVVDLEEALNDPDFSPRISS